MDSIHDPIAVQSPLNRPAAMCRRSNEMLHKKAPFKVLCSTYPLGHLTVFLEAEYFAPEAQLSASGANDVSVDKPLLWRLLFLC
jgi:hypothetical protein